MSKSSNKGKKQRLTPEKPKEVVRKLKKNNLVLLNQKGGDAFWFREVDGTEYMAVVPMHPEEIRQQLLRNIIRKSGKDRKEWLSL